MSRAKTQAVDQEMSPLVLRKEPAVSVLISFGPESKKIPSVQAAADIARTNSPVELAKMAGRGSAASEPAAAAAVVFGRQVTPAASCSAPSAAGSVHWRKAVALGTSWCRWTVWVRCRCQLKDLSSSRLAVAVASSPDKTPCPAHGPEWML